MYEASSWRRQPYQHYVFFVISGFDGYKPYVQCTYGVFRSFFTVYDISEGLSAITRIQTCKPSHSRNKQAAKLPKADLLFFLYTRRSPSGVSCSG